MSWNPRLRLYLASLMVSLWLLLLMTGFVLGGLAHVLLAGALLAFPWTVLARSDPKNERSEPPPASH